MVSFIFFIWFLVLLGAIIGAMRGWAKELLVFWSGILGIFIILVLESYVEVVQTLITDPASQFWMRAAIMTLMAIFGYETPRIRYLASATRREYLHDSLLGLFIGGLNGWLFFGSIWAYLHQVNYLIGKSDIYSKLFIPPAAGTDIGDSVLALLNRMPPQIGMFNAPGIYLILAVVSVTIVILLV